MFVLLQWVAFSFMAGMGELVPDIPDDVTLQLQRTEFLASKVSPRSFRFCFLFFLHVYENEVYIKIHTSQLLLLLLL